MNNYLNDLWIKAPLSWAIIRARECQVLEKEEFIHPILEIGCGDGLFAQVLFKKNIKIDVGIDSDENEIRRAKKSNMYNRLICTSVTNLPFKNCSFKTVFINGVLEHIPELSTALGEINRILKPRGKLITTSPSDVYSKQLGYYRLLNYFGLTILAKKYASLINRLFLHYHLLSPKQWKKKLEKNHFSLENVVFYNSPQIILIHDLFLPFAVLSKIVKKYTDSMVLFPNFRKILIKPFVPLLNMFIRETGAIDKRSSILLIAKKYESLEKNNFQFN